MSKYSGLFRNYLGTSLQYRTDVILTIIRQVIIIIMAVIIWSAIFRNRDQVAGYQYQDMFWYYLLIPLVGFISNVRISDQLGSDIRQGFFSNYLLKPFRVWVMALMKALADKFNLLLFAIPVYIIFLVIYALNYQVVNFELSAILLALFFCIIAFLLNFFMDITISWLAFWMDDIWWFSHFKGIIFMTLGGVRFPLDLLPKNISGLINFLPFKYLYFVPMSYLMNKRDLNLLFNDFLSIVVWISFFCMVMLFLWRQGIKQYGAYGN